MTPAAVFDVDRTLLPGTTTERLFTRSLVRQGELGWRQALAALLFGLRRPSPRLVEAYRAERPYLHGLHYPRLVDLARRCFEQEIRPRLAREGLDRLRAHRADGLLTVLLSGSLAELIAPLARFTGADVSIASQLRLRADRVTGGLVGPHPYGVAKAQLVGRLAVERQIDLSASYCYADHDSDAAMLRLFGHPVCVNPNTRLLRLARSYGWPVETFA